METNPGSRIEHQISSIQDRGSSIQNPTHMKNTFLLSILIFLSTTLCAQQSDYYHPVKGANNSDFTGYSGTGANLDVVYQRINWNVDPRLATNTLTGTVVIHFKTISANVSAINFDLNKNSFNNGSLSVIYHGSPCTYSFPSSGNVNIINITIPNIPAINTLDSVTINYSGIPPAPSGAAQGYQRYGSTPDQYTTSLSESYEDRDWWPCKADMQDKIDSMDINVTVPWVNNANGDTFWVATNGILYDSTIGAGTRLFKFKTRYPIATYLVCLSVGKFTRYYRTAYSNGFPVPTVYNILRNTSSHATKTIAMDKINVVLDTFSRMFGHYPFKLEKHGFYDGLVGAGGMEHQTFSAMASGSMANLATLTHELMHQWFGDNVTFGSWNDLWLAEGPARYSEILAAETVPVLGYTPAQVNTMRTNVKNGALALNAHSAWIPNANIGSSSLIWSSSYGSTVYQRGGMVISMLRALSGDTKFFQAMTNYQTAMTGKSATADSLRNHFNAVLGQDISEFFRVYVGGSGGGAVAVGGIGNPVINMLWNTPATNHLVVRVMNQTQTAGSNVSYFNGPVVMHFTNAASGWTQDTTIVIFDWGSGALSYAGNGLSNSIPGNLLSYDLSFTPTHAFYDDSARTLSTGTISKLTTLAAGFSAIRAYVQDKDIMVEWSYADQQNISQYNIEHSVNGTDFLPAGTQQVVFNGNPKYQWLHISPLPGDHYYRIVAKSTGGQLIYSQVVKQTLGQVLPGIEIYPNPTTSQWLNLRFIEMDRGGYSMQIYSNSGQLIDSRTLNHTGGSSVIQISLGLSIKNGTYKLVFRRPDGVKMEREIVVIR